MFSARKRASLVIVVSLAAWPCLAQSPSGALTLLKISGDLKIIDSGSLIFNDNTVQATAGVTSVGQGTGILVTGTKTVTVASDTTYLQRRVNGACSGAIVGINDDGSVACGVIGQTVALTSNTQITIPSAVGHLLVEAWAGGGGGAGYADGPFGSGGGGGGSGAYARVLMPIAPGLIDIHIGTGGAAASDHQNGGAGGETSIIYIPSQGSPLLPGSPLLDQGGPVLIVSGGSGGSGVTGGQTGMISSFAGGVIIQDAGVAGGNGNNFGAFGAGGIVPLANFGTGGNGSGSAGLLSKAGTNGLMLITYEP